MSDYLVTREFFAATYWGQWYWGGVGIRHAEVLRASVILQRLVAAGCVMNKMVAEVTMMPLTVPENTVLNKSIVEDTVMSRVVADRYDELEAV